MYISVADPDLQIRGGGRGHSDPEIRGEGGLKIFLRPFGAQFGLKKEAVRVPALDAPLHLTLFIERTFVRH